MSGEQVKAQLKRIFIVMPSVKKWIEATDEPNATLNAWISMLEGCNSDDLEHVVSKVVSGELEAIGQWDKPDVLPRVLKRYASDRASRRNAKEHQQEKYHNNSRGLMSEVRKSKFGRFAISVGCLVREKKITKEQNDVLYYELRDWDRGGDIPQWLTNGEFDAAKAIQYANNHQN